MNVKQLRNLLLDYPDDLEILIAEEDGDYSYQVSEMGLMFIFPNSDKHGGVDQLIDPAEVGPGLEYSSKEVEPRLVLWP